jgi:hypothetical protein
MRPFTIVSAQPDDLLFCWSLRVQLCQMRKIDWAKHYHVLLFTPFDRLNQPKHPEWAKLIADYPETEFFWYPDTNNFLKQIHAFGYIPLLRPHILEQHWKAHPELEKHLILYTDSDVLYLHQLPIADIADDEYCYLSNTQGYNAASYFDSKVADVLPEKLESYKKIDVLDGAMKILSLSRQVAVDNEQNTGGAQYLLKGINATFWTSVCWDCVSIKTYLQDINRKYFANEDKGFQSWASDMFSVLWNLWKIGKQTKTPQWMDFAWATDPIEKWDTVNIYHDAGVVSDVPEMFYKRKLKYITNESTPFEDDLSQISPKYCSFNYVRAIKDSAPK